MKCAVVDAWSTGQYLPGALRAHGAECVSVQSAPLLPEFCRRSMLACDLPADVVHAEDLQVTAAALAELDVDIVVAGSETGVELADALSDALNLPGNGVRLTRARRDKLAMAEAVRSAGLAAIESMASSREAGVVAWAVAHGTWPVVLKPIDSAGTDNVIFCMTPDDVRQAHRKIMSSVTLLGHRNTTVLIQEFLDGTEYFANTISEDGQHLVAEVWRYHKRPVPGGGFIYDFEHPLPADDPAACVIGDYVVEVLGALAIRHGPAHTEVMMTSDGPVLIECGARLAGSILPDVVTRCFGTNHVDLTALALTAPAEFRRYVGQARELRTHLRYVSLICPMDGVMRTLDPLRELPSFAGMAIPAEPGSRVTRTVDSATSPGYVYLVAADLDQIEADYQLLRKLEATALYEFASC